MDFELTLQSTLNQLDTKFLGVHPVFLDVFLSVLVCIEKICSVTKERQDTSGFYFLKLFLD